MAKRLMPLLNRVLVEKIVPPAKTSSGILLPESSAKTGNHIPPAVKEGDHVLLPEYGGTAVKLGEKRETESVAAPEDNLLFYRSLDGESKWWRCPICYAIAMIYAVVARLLLWLLQDCCYCCCGLCYGGVVVVAMIDVDDWYHLYRDEDIMGTLHD
ncbi:10 kDa chaperonin mitochondrial [Bienertia sinuspersici]